MLVCNMHVKYMERTLCLMLPLPFAGSATEEGRAESPGQEDRHQHIRGRMRSLSVLLTPAASFTGVFLAHSLVMCDCCRLMSQDAVWLCRSCSP